MTNGSIQLIYLINFCVAQGHIPFSSLIYVHAHWLKGFLRLSKITAELIEKETGPQDAVK